MLEIIVHGVVSVTVIVAATVLAGLRDIDSTAWTAAIGAGIATSGAVSVFQGKIGNGHIADEALMKLQRPGGKRQSDPPAIHEEGN